MTILEELLRDAGDELDRLSHEWQAADRRQPPGRRRRLWRPVMAAAGLAAAAASGLVAVNRNDGAPPSRTVPAAATTAPPPIAPADLPVELLAAPPAGYELVSGHHGSLGKDFEPPVVLLAWQGGVPGEPHVYVTVERTSPAMDAPAGAEEVDTGAVTGWIGRFGPLLNAQFDVAGQPLSIHVFDSGVPDEDVLALAAAVTGAGPEVTFAGGAPPEPFVELARQRVDAIVSVASYRGPDGASILYGVATDIPLDQYPSDAAITVERINVAGRPGIVRETEIEGQPSRQLFWLGADGAWRTLSSSAPDAPLPLDQLLALAAATRPATLDERGLFDSLPVQGPEPEAEAAATDPANPPYVLLDPVPAAFELISTAEQDGGADARRPALLLGWNRGDGELLPIVVARADAIWRSETAAGTASKHDVESATVSGTVATGDGVTAASLDVGGVVVYMQTPSLEVPDDDLVAIAAALIPDATTLDWTDGGPPAGVVELARQEAAFTLHDATYRRGATSLFLASYSAMPASWMTTAPGASARSVSVGGNPGFELVQPGSGATTRWMYWTDETGVVYALTEDSPTGHELDLVAIAETIVTVTPEEFADAA